MFKQASAANEIAIKFNQSLLLQKEVQKNLKFAADVLSGHGFSKQANKLALLIEHDYKHVNKNQNVKIELALEKMSDIIEIYNNQSFFSKADFVLNVLESFASDPPPIDMSGLPSFEKNPGEKTVDSSRAKIDKELDDKRKKELEIALREFSGETAKPQPPIDIRKIRREFDLAPTKSDKVRRIESLPPSALHELKDYAIDYLKKKIHKDPRFKLINSGNFFVAKLNELVKREFRFLLNNPPTHDDRLIAAINHLNNSNLTDLNFEEVKIILGDRKFMSDQDIANYIANGSPYDNLIWDEEGRYRDTTREKPIQLVETTDFTEPSNSFMNAPSKRLKLNSIKFNSLKKIAKKTKTKKTYNIKFMEKDYKEFGMPFNAPADDGVNDNDGFNVTPVMPTEDEKISS